MYMYFRGVDRKEERREGEKEGEEKWWGCEGEKRVRDERMVGKEGEEGGE